MLMHWAEIRCFCDDSPEQNHNFCWCHGQVVASQQDTADLYEISEDYSSVADHLQNNLLISKILRVLLTTCYNPSPSAKATPALGAPGHSKGTTVVQTLQLWVKSLGTPYPFLFLSFSSFWWPGNFGLATKSRWFNGWRLSFSIICSMVWFLGASRLSWQCPKYPDCSEAISGRVILAPCQRPQ